MSPLDAWRLMTEPMSKEEANLAAEAIMRALPHVHAIPADPRTNLVAAWDRRTVELVRDALLAVGRSGTEVPEHIISVIEEWLAHADPLEDPAVPLVEELLTMAAAREPFETPTVDGRHVAAHALWMCACVTMQDAPTWVVYDSPNGSGLAWLTIPDDLDVPDVVDARHVAGGHTAPDGVLRWLRGEVPSSSLDIDGDLRVLEVLEPRLREA